MMLTRCPACSTTFRVSPEQLKARAGKVRCGECRSQFNALDTLVEENIFPATINPPYENTIQPSEELVSPAVEEAGSDITEAFPEMAEQATAEPEPLHAVEEVAETNDESEIIYHSDESADVAETVSPALSDDAVQESSALEAHSTTSEIIYLPDKSADVAETISPVLSEDAVQDSSALEEPYDTTFEAVPDGEAETTHGRWRWVIGIIAALLVLAAQAALHFRVELAVLQPALKPTLIAVCKFLGCEVLLPQQAQFLGIEASDLHPDPLQKGHLVLSATLSNHAPFAQELPVIELTLNDVADRPLIVKDINPRDYLPQDIDISKGIASNGEIAVNLTLDVGDVPAAGYRIYLFYP